MRRFLLASKNLKRRYSLFTKKTPIVINYQFSPFPASSGSGGKFLFAELPQAAIIRATMMYLIAILIPPLAVLLCGKPLQFVLNLLLCVFFWVPGMIHAILVVADTKAQERNQALIDAINRQR